MSETSWRIFSVLSNMRNVSEQLLRVHKLFDEYRLSYMIFSSGPKKSRTKILKIKTIVPKWKVWPISSLFTHCSRHRVSVCSAPQGILAYLVQVIRSFLKHQRGCWKYIFLTERLSFQWKRIFWCIVLRNIECNNPWRKICKGPWGVLTNTVEIIRSFLQEVWACWKHKLWKRKASFPVKKRFWTIFSHFTECDNPHEKVYMELKGHFFGPKWLLKKQNFEEKAKFSVQKEYGLFSLVISSTTNAREQLLRAHKFFDEYCTSHKIFSPGHKQSRTKVFKINAIIPKENFWPIFSLITHYGRHLVSIV